MNNYHNKEIKAVLKGLGGTENGLAGTEAEKRRKKYGKNEIPKEKRISAGMIFLSQFNNSLVYVLLLAGALSLVLQEGPESIVIFGAVLINVVIGFFQENKANRAIENLRKLVEHKAIVLRDGKETVVDSFDVVVGDILLIKAGNRISADARVIEAAELEVNEAGLTGESLPSGKISNPVALGASLADRENMVYAGTLAVKGIGRAVVTAIGHETEIGKIASMVSEAKEEKTPLQKKLNKFSRFLGLIFGSVCVLIFSAGMLQGRSFFSMIETAVAVGVASIPEGLTVAVTFILALGVQQILKRQGLVRRLLAAETLGSVTVICTDKTGTLTEGKMHVAHIVIGDKKIEMNSLENLDNDPDIPAASLALRAGMMCNDSFIENPHDELKSWKIVGSPTEAALMSAAVQSGLDKEELLRLEPKIAELPFNSENKFMLSLHQSNNDDYILYEKGAPEKLLEKTGYFYEKGAVLRLTQEKKNLLVKTYEKMTAKGLRVIGLSLKKFSASTETDFSLNKKVNDWKKINRDMTFIGFVAIKDPLRPEAKETIRLCREAGIRPIIITGDHNLTARAVALEIGIEAEKENIVTGEMLDVIDDEKFKSMTRVINVYARVSPHHKLRIVKSLQEQGEIVAMTGDGINDSPALKAANIGISLGTGTDIAKEASDIVLLDDNFKTIVAIVKQGRIIFKNIRKVLTFLISSSFSEMILIIGSILFNTPLAILPAQILWINIVNDGFSHFPLAFEKDRGTVMREKPLKKNEPLFNREMKEIIFGVCIVRDLLIFALFYFLWREWQHDPAQIAYLQTLIFAILGTKSLIGIFGIRSFHTPFWKINIFENKYLLLGVGCSFVFLLLGIYWPPLQTLLSTVALDLWGWLISLCIGILSLISIEFVKNRYVIRENNKKMRFLADTV